MNPRRCIAPSALLFSLSLGGAALAQEKPPPELAAPPAASVQREAHGVALVEGHPWGGGPGYKVFFRDGGFEFTPALGRAAPRNFPLAFELEAIERGGVLVHAPAAPAAPELGTDEIVRYAHPGGIEERYEVRADGVEQSFVFAEPLPGAGDLVVRGRLTTELGGPLGEREELELTMPGLGGVRIGAVTGVDAAGRTARGSLRHDGVSVELVLPAEFVDAARYPLVLDPLIGATFLIAASTTQDESDPDVAFDADSFTYLVAWHLEYSATDMDILAQRYGTSGAQIGGVIPIEVVANTLAKNPTVANVRSSKRFLVAWQHDTTFTSYDIKACGVNAGDGGVSLTLTVASQSADEIDPDACGEQTLLEDDALLIWERQDAGIYGAQVQLLLSGTPVLINSFTVTGDGAAYRPAISKSGGSAGRALLAFNSTLAGNADIYVGLYDRNGASIFGPILWAGGPHSDSEPAVDGDGTNWIVAYVHGESGLDPEIFCRRVTFNPSTSSLSYGLTTALTSDTVNQSSPAVAWTPGKAFVAWQEQYQDAIYDTDVYVRGIDPSDCGTCEPTLTLDYSETLDGEPELASQYAGGSSGDQVFATWHSGVGGFLTLDQIDVKGQLLEAFGGGSYSLQGGGCGNGGVITIGGSGPGSIAAGNPTFSVALNGADPFATTAILVTHPPATPFVCGGCSVILPGSLFTVPITGGTASKTLPIPCDLSIVGAQLDLQWAVLLTTAVPCPLFGNVSASDRLRITIGQ